MTEFNEMQRIKRRFFAMRNGIVADTLRRSGLDYKMIFGLNLPQIAEIARELNPSMELAAELWSDRRSRESMLLAPMVCPPSEMDEETASRWLREAPTPEVADILCHRLLRHLPYARTLAMRMISSPSDMDRYTAFRLLFNLLPEGAAGVRPLALAEYQSGTSMTRTLTRQLLDEIDFLLDA